MRGTFFVAALAMALAACEAKPRATPSSAGSAAPPPSAPSAKAARAAQAAVSSGACPAEMARVEDFCIDRYEAHLVDAAAPERALSPYERPDAGVAALARARPGVVPQAYLDRTEAAAACARAGKRLCKAREWYRACAGTRSSRHPYGDVEIQGRCNTGKAHVMQKVFGNVRFTFINHYNSPRLNREPGFLAATGAHADCVSEGGVYDLVGNLHEWVADAVSRDLSTQIPLEIGAHQIGWPGNGVFMGGYYSSHGEHGSGCAYATTNHKPDYHDYSIGFRCCAPLATSEGAAPPPE